MRLEPPRPPCYPLSACVHAFLERPHPAHHSLSRGPTLAHFWFSSQMSSPAAPPPSSPHPRVTLPPVCSHLSLPVVHFIVSLFQDEPPGCFYVRGGPVSPSAPRWMRLCMLNTLSWLLRRRAFCTVIVCFGAFSSVQTRL